MWAKRDLARLERAAGAFGGVVDYQGGGVEFVNIDAPRGKVWSTNGGHTIVADYGLADDPDRRKHLDETIADALERISHGVADCGDVECDICNEVTSDE